MSCAPLWCGEGGERGKPEGRFGEQEDRSLTRNRAHCTGWDRRHCLGRTRKKGEELHAPPPSSSILLEVNRSFARPSTSARCRVSPQKRIFFFESLFTALEYPGHLRLDSIRPSPRQPLLGSPGRLFAYPTERMNSSSASVWPPTACPGGNVDGRSRSTISTTLSSSL